MYVHTEEHAYVHACMHVHVYIPCSNTYSLFLLCVFTHARTFSAQPELQVVPRHTCDGGMRVRVRVRVRVSL